jgi:hypothetical protein
VTKRREAAAGKKANFALVPRTVARSLAVLIATMLSHGLVADPARAEELGARPDGARVRACVIYGHGAATRSTVAIPGPSQVDRRAELWAIPPKSSMIGGLGATGGDGRGSLWALLPLRLCKHPVLCCSSATVVMHLRTAGCADIPTMSSSGPADRFSPSVAAQGGWCRGPEILTAGIGAGSVGIP